MYYYAISTDPNGRDWVLILKDDCTSIWRRLSWRGFNDLTSLKETLGKGDTWDNNIETEDRILKLSAIGKEFSGNPDEVHYSGWVESLEEVMQSINMYRLLGV